MECGGQGGGGGRLSPRVACAGQAKRLLWQHRGRPPEGSPGRGAGWPSIGPPAGSSRRSGGSAVVQRGMGRREGYEMGSIAIVGGVREVTPCRVSTHTEARGEPRDLAVAADLPEHVPPCHCPRGRPLNLSPNRRRARTSFASPWRTPHNHDTFLGLHTI